MDFQPKLRSFGGKGASPVPVKVGVRRNISTPGDAMQSGIHSDLRTSSAHKSAVSGVLHLKKESAGHRGNPTAFSVSKHAFKAPKGSK